MMNTERTSLFLMANLGSEVSRIISARNAKEESVMRNSLERADKMIAEIKNLDDMKPRRKEIEMLSVAIHALIDPFAELYKDAQNIQDYFMPFALKLMANR